MSPGTLELARKTWIASLIDLSRRNNLLYYRETKRGTLDISQMAVEKLREAMSGSAVALEDIIPPDLLPDSQKTLNSIRRKALSFFEEKGLDTLHLAFGFASWGVDDSGRPPEAAVFLVPLKISRKGRGWKYLMISATDDPTFSPVLAHVMREQKEIQLPAALSEEEVSRLVADPFAYLEHVQETLFSKTDVSITQKIAVANFLFQKMSMVKDIRDSTDSQLGNNLVRALIGQVDARVSLKGKRKPIDLDEIAPEADHSVMSADSSQQMVIQRALDGESGVVHGPPGTGKSQTITNLISAMIGAGKRVLFVAEKRAALDVVLKRLREVGLENTVLDIHGSSLSKKDFYEG